ncbi:hypothetical protein [Sinosporangium siamense]|uniref:Uncharacterized protein n=1 Tax=Sinosporangium siamense TaxID=1367973 RepID=A0A919RNW1_9ACTN|nr:hypothetical protein [Sinosporangium siamense]GII97221.1 hypothetical protein Ssi02_74520 [Sinosporangium siamense]
MGNYAYGRYLSCVAIAWALAGLAVLARRGRRTIAAGAGGALALLAGTGAVAALYAGDRLRRYNFIAFDFPETSFLTGRYDALDMAGASAAAAGLLLCFVLAAGALAHLHRLRVTLVAAAVMAVNVLFTVVVAQQSSVPSGGGGIPPLQRGGVALDREVDWTVRLWMTYRIPWTRIERFDAGGAAVPPGTCTVVVPLPEGVRPADTWQARPEGWAPVGSGGPPRGWVAWSAPSCLKGDG